MRITAMALQSQLRRQDFRRRFWAEATPLPYMSSHTTQIRGFPRSDTLSRKMGVQ